MEAMLADKSPKDAEHTSNSFDNAIHYLRIARWPEAKVNLQYVVLYSKPGEIFELSQKMSDSEKILRGALAVKEVAAEAQDVLKALEQGRRENATLVK